MQPEVGSVTCRECATRIWCSWPSVITHLANRLFKFSLMATSCSALSLDSSASMTLTWRKRKEFSHKRKFGLHAVKLPWVLGGKIHPRNLDSLMTGLPPENCKMFYNFNWLRWVWKSQLYLTRKNVSYIWTIFSLNCFLEPEVLLFLVDIALCRCLHCGWLKNLGNWAPTNNWIQ